MDLLHWIESTATARAVGESLMLTAWLSAAHAVGFTLVMSGGLVANLNAAGALLRALPVTAIERPARRLLLVGLAISAVSGLFLFAPRASSAAASGSFQLKMALLLVAVAYQLTLGRAGPTEPVTRTVRRRLGGGVGVALWLALALAACWFILFE